MLKASDALDIYLGAVDVTQYITYLEDSIIARAKDHFRWFPWDYQFDNVSSDEKHEVINQLRAAGYDVKDEWLNKRLIIRW